MAGQKQSFIFRFPPLARFLLFVHEVDTSSNARDGR
jgi:hypothetical protein